jgi:hypothetical protein
MSATEARMRHLFRACGLLGVVVAAAVQAQAAPLELLAPPDRVTLTLREGVPIVFTWRSAGASSYRFQLAQDRGFSKVIMDRRVSGTSTTVRELPSGVYYWRCSADGTGAKTLSFTLVVGQRSSQ